LRRCAAVLAAVVLAGCPLDVGTWTEPATNTFCEGLKVDVVLLVDRTEDPCGFGADYVRESTAFLAALDAAGADLRVAVVDSAAQCGPEPGEGFSATVVGAPEERCVYREWLPSETCELTFCPALTRGDRCAEPLPVEPLCEDLLPDGVAGCELLCVADGKCRAAFGAHARCVEVDGEGRCGFDRALPESCLAEGRVLSNAELDKLPCRMGMGLGAGCASGANEGMGQLWRVLEAASTTSPNVDGGLREDAILALVVASRLVDCTGRDPAEDWSDCGVSDLNADTLRALSGLLYLKPPGRMQAGFVVGPAGSSGEAYRDKLQTYGAECGAHFGLCESAASGPVHAAPTFHALRELLFPHAFLHSPCTSETPFQRMFEQLAGGVIGRYETECGVGNSATAE